MSSNILFVRHSCRVLPFLLNFSGIVWRGGGKLEINLLPQKIYARSKEELIIEGRVMSSEYDTCLHEVIPTKFWKPFCYQTLLVHLTALEQLAAMFISWY